MRLANVPPPMALHEIEISSNIIDVAIKIGSNHHPTAIVGVLHHLGYSQFEWSLSSMVQNPPVCRFTNDLSPDIGTMPIQDRLYLQVSFSGNTSLLFSKGSDHSSFNVFSEDGGHVGQVFLHGTDIEGMITDWGVSKSKTYVMLDHDGKLSNKELKERVQDCNDNGMAGIELVLSPSSAQRVDAIVCGFETEHAVNGLANGNEAPATKDIIFSLSEAGSLFANERRLARNCTSFLVTPVHLIFTTSQHLLKFVHLTGDTEGEFPRPNFSSFILTALQ